jgi:shikimate dehydrogenase
VKFAIIGDPVEHSRSPAIHNAAFAALDIDAEFGFMPVAESNFGEVVDALRSEALDGVSVTMPHKHNAYAAADELSETAARTGAVNTLVVVDDRLVGHNTDVTGVRHTLGTVDTNHDQPILILGYGGAAAAALLAVDGRTVYISGRTEDRAAALAERVDVNVEVVPWKTPVAMATVINATPLGMAGENLPDGIVERAGAFVDMTYGTQRSQAVAQALALGLPTADGLTMLVGQAFEAFELFTGRKPPEMAMEQAARQAG